MIYFLVGDKNRKIKYDKLTSKIKKNNPGLIKKVYDVSQGEEEDFIEEISTDSIFGGKKFLILKRTEKIKKITGFLKGLEKFNFNNKEVIIDFSTENKKFSKYAVKRAKKLGKIIEVKNDKKNFEVINFIKSELKITSPQAHDLMEMIGTDITNIKTEIKKIQNYLDGEKFKIDKIKNIINISVEYSIFELIDNMLKGKKNGLISFLRQEKSYMLFLYLFFKKMKMSLKLKLLQDQGLIQRTYKYNVYQNKYYPEIKKYISGHPYAIFMALKSLDKTMEIQDYQRILYDLLKVELSIKSGKIDIETAMEIFIMKF
ncbi:MAG: DNA polymerase III subunit delta [Fusobacteriota bacterium]